MLRKTGKPMGFGRGFTTSRKFPLVSRFDKALDNRLRDDDPEHPSLHMHVNESTPQAVRDEYNATLLAAQRYTEYLEDTEREEEALRFFDDAAPVRYWFSCLSPGQHAHFTDVQASLGEEPSAEKLYNFHLDVLAATVREIDNLPEDFEVKTRKGLVERETLARLPGAHVEQVCWVILNFHELKEREKKA